MKGILKVVEDWELATTDWEAKCFSTLDSRVELGLRLPASVGEALVHWDPGGTDTVPVEG